MLQSIFQQPSPRRQRQQTLSDALNGPTITDEDALRAAIASIAARSSDGIDPRGALILLTTGFSVSETIVIPFACFGLTILSQGRVPLVAAGEIGTFFDVRAPLVTLQNIYVIGDDENFADLFCQLSRESDKLVPSFTRVLDCDLKCNRLFDDVGLGTGGHRIEGNIVHGVENTHTACVSVSSSDGSLIGNTFHDGGGDVVTLSVGAAAWYCAGNKLQFGDFTSSASNGLNTIVGNTRRGTITKHATDAEGLNT